MAAVAVVSGGSRRPPPPLSLMAARQSLVDNGRLPVAEGWWETELFTGNCVFLCGSFKVA
jgi:hypothetical protein